MGVWSRSVLQSKGNNTGQRRSHPSCPLFSWGPQIGLGHALRPAFLVILGRSKGLSPVSPLSRLYDSKLWRSPGGQPFRIASSFPQCRDQELFYKHRNTLLFLWFLSHNIKPDPKTNIMLYANCDGQIHFIKSKTVPCASVNLWQIIPFVSLSAESYLLNSSFSPSGPLPWNPAFKYRVRRSEKEAGCFLPSLFNKRYPDHPATVCHSQRNLGNSLTKSTEIKLKAIWWPNF